MDIEIGVGECLQDLASRKHDKTINLGWWMEAVKMGTHMAKMFCELFLREMFYLFFSRKLLEHTQALYLQEKYNRS